MVSSAVPLIYSRLQLHSYDKTWPDLSKILFEPPSSRQQTRIAAFISFHRSSFPGADSSRTPNSYRNYSRSSHTEKTGDQFSFKVLKFIYLNISLSCFLSPDSNSSYYFFVCGCWLLMYIHKLCVAVDYAAQVNFSSLSRSRWCKFD